MLLFLSLKGICLTKHQQKKIGGPGVWKEKRIVTLMSSQDFDFINCVCFLAQSPEEKLTFFMM